MYFEFLHEVGSDITWEIFAAQCWNLALLYFAFEIIKFFDSKIEKIIRRIRMK